MLSGVLHSRRGIQVNVIIMRTFVRLRQMLASNARMARQLEESEEKCDGQFKVVFDALRELMTPPADWISGQRTTGAVWETQSPG